MCVSVSLSVSVSLALLALPEVVARHASHTLDALLEGKKEEVILVHVFGLDGFVVFQQPIGLEGLLEHWPCDARERERERERALAM